MMYANTMLDECTRQYHRLTVLWSLARFSLILGFVLPPSIVALSLYQSQQMGLSRVPAGEIPALWPTITFLLFAIPGFVVWIAAYMSEQAVRRRVAEAGVDVEWWVQSLRPMRRRSSIRHWLIFVGIGVLLLGSILFAYYYYMNSMYKFVEENFKVGS